MENPLTAPQSGPADEELVIAARAGDRKAAESLLARHQPWIFNIAMRMLWIRADAEDATQEILIKVWRHIDSFRGESAFRTWLYRIAINHILDMRQQGRSVAEPRRSFAERTRLLAELPDQDLPDPQTLSVPLEVLVDEVKIGCTTGVLLCLDGRQRLVFILGEILGANDEVGAAIVGVTSVNFRQILSRARRDLYQYLNGSCSLLNPGAACSCARKTRTLLERGVLDPNKLQFTAEYRQRVRDVVRARVDELEEAHRRGSAVFREHPFYKSQDPVAAARQVLATLSPDLLS